MTDLTLNARQKKLLSILNARHNVETGKELAAKLGVSERTVRNDIRAINSKLKQYEIQILPQYGKGYTISVNNREVYLQLFSEKANYETKEDRIRTMMLRLIRENDWYELGNLEDEMFVSRTTLESDIRAMRQRVSVRYPYLQIRRQGNYIKFEKDEIKRRALLIRLYAENWDYDSRDGIVLKQDEFGRECLEEIQDVFKDELYRCQTDLDDFGLIYMVLAIAVMQFRVNSGNTIEVFEKKGESQGIAAVVRYVLDALKELWQIELQENEYLWLSDIFYQIQILNTQNMTKAAVLGYTYPVCHNIVREMLQQVKNVYGLDFTTDDRLFADLCVHVQTLKRHFRTADPASCLWR